MIVIFYNKIRIYVKGGIRLRAIALGLLGRGIRRLVLSAGLHQQEYYKGTNTKTTQDVIITIVIVIVHGGASFPWFKDFGPACLERNKKRKKV